MTFRSVRPNELLLRNLHRKFIARHSVTATDASFLRIVNLPGNPAAGESKATKPKTNGTGDVQIDFTDSKKLFSTVSSGKLLKSLITLKVTSCEPVAKFGTVALDADLLNAWWLYRKLALGFTERTFYPHFCAGKDLEKATATVTELWQSGISAMLDYGLERANDNEMCDRNTREFIRTIDSTKSSAHDFSPVSFVAVKVTAICPPRVLQRVSDLLRWEYKDSSMNLPWKMKTLPILCDFSPFYHTQHKPDPLTLEEERDLQLAYDRMFKICQKSLDINRPLLIDAEETNIQPAIDYLTYSSVLKFGSNPGQRPLIFNTIQAYLIDSSERLKNTVEAAEKLGIQIGIKLVRGAYMNSEKLKASEYCAPSPIHPSIKKTHECYDKCTDFLLHKIKMGTAFAVLATHNVESGKMAAMKAVNLGIDRRRHCLYFAQLYGMAEALSFGLKNEGFNVSKYLPFGPVDQIMPYLLRRAEENKCMLGASSNDIKLMRKELIRRLTSSKS